MRFRLFVAWNIRLVVFLYIFCFLVILVLLMFVLSELFLITVISLPPRFFLCSLQVVISIPRCYLDYWWVLFLLLFLTYIGYLRHLWDIRPLWLSWVLVLWSICWSLSLFYFKIGLEYLPRGDIFSCDLWSLYPPVYFLSMGLSGIIVITNSNGDSALPWKIPLLIFISINLFLLLSVRLSSFPWYFW